MGVGINGTQHLWPPSTYPPAVPRSRLLADARCLLWQVEHGKMIVHDLALGRDRKVRRDDPGCTCKLSCATGHIPQHTTPLQSFDPAGKHVALPQGFKLYCPKVAVGDGACLIKRAIGVDYYPGGKSGLPAAERFQRRLDTVRA